MQSSDNKDEVKPKITLSKKCSLMQEPTPQEKVPLHIPNSGFYTGNPKWTQFLLHNIC